MVRAIASLLLATALAVPAATAAERNDPRSATQARAVGGASAGYARLVLLYDFEYGVIRSKGVTSMRRVATGHYCIRPSSLSSSTVQASVPQVSVDYSGSSGDALLATVRTNSSRCSSSEFAVQTLRGDDGGFDPSNAVGFSFFVP